MLNNRQKEILKLIVREFVSTAEPVGSLAITQNYDIGCCSATVRNDMARLEEMGYLEQPHSSAGRIPKDKAYRLFVDDIIRNKISLPPERDQQTIEREYDLTQAQLENLLEKTARLLSQLTHYTSVILAPQIRRNLFKYLKLVPLDSERVLLFLMTNTGSVIHRIIHVSSPMEPEVLERITNILNERLQSKSMGNIERFLNGMASHEHYNELIEIVRDASQKIMEEQEHTREVFFGGRTHLLDFTEFRDLNRIKVLMELIEEEKVIAEILSGTLKGDGIQVFIGEENPVDGMRECSMIMAVYSIEGEPVGTLGILGPKRMPYEQIIPIVTYTAENFSNKLSVIDRL
jgi:heat-inducible transcriptional repressor